MPRKEVKTLSMGDILEQVSDGIRQQVNRPNLYAYKPHAKQYKFHTSLKKTRLYIGGNRSGKTTGGAVEMCYWLMKKHPYRKLPLPEGPIRARACAVDFDYGVDVLLIPELKRWLPPSFLKNGSWEDSYDRQHRTLTLANKSFLEFRSYDQDLEKFAGTSRHIIWFDEEPPKHIYTENMARLVDTAGYSMLTMTPVEGMSWVYDDLYVPGMDGSDLIEVIEISMTENPHLTKEAIDQFLGTLDKEERAAREKGTFVTIGGKIFKTFDPDIHVIEPPALSEMMNWRWFASFDHGFNNPTAIEWHAVSPDNEIITFDEHYASEMTVKEHAKVFLEKERAHNRKVDFIVGDPAMHQRNGVTGTSIVQEYAEHGIYIAEANNDVPSGINRMQQYLRVRENGQPSWHISQSCPALIGEMKKLRWATYESRKLQARNNPQEKIHKKDDHACDSTRYFFSFMPDLTPPKSELENTSELIKQHSETLGAIPQAAVSGSWDQVLAQQLNERKEQDPWNYSYGEY